MHIRGEEAGPALWCTRGTRQEIRGYAPEKVRGPHHWPAPTRFKPPATKNRRAARSCERDFDRQSAKRQMMLETIFQRRARNSVWQMYRVPRAAAQLCAQTHLSMLALFHARQIVGI